MATSNSDDQRIAKLSFLFNKVIHGERDLSTTRDGKLFLEALCAQADPATCAHKLLSMPSGISALQMSVRFDTSVSFLNSHATPLLQYFQSPALKLIGSGSILIQLLRPLIDPPFFWDAFAKSFTAGLLVPEACHAFSWLLLELISQPGKESLPYVALANSPPILNLILDAPNGQTRILGQKIKQALLFDSSELHIDAEARPGGRHDNDYSDHREVSIMPTADELLSKDRPFFRTADFIEKPELKDSRAAIHIDNQFRLLREEMLGEIRDELKVLAGTKPGRHRGITITNISIAGVNMGTDRKRLPLGFVFNLQEGLPQLKNIIPGKQKPFLNDNRHILRQGSMACLLIDNEPVAFPTIYRDEDELCMIPAKITLQFADDPTMSKALAGTKTSNNVKLVQLDSAIFAFEPFLRRLQEIIDLPLREEILDWEEGNDIEGSPFQPTKIIRGLEDRLGKDLKNFLRLEKSVTLDESQMSSLCTSLKQKLSLVQGPPGTGKSFIGALVAKILYESTAQTILVVCFTNHALDQFLEDLMDIGIPLSKIVRLGGKSTDRTKPLMIREQKSMKLNPDHWARIDKLKQRLQNHENRIQDVFKRFRNSNIQKNQLMDYLEFLSEDLPFFDAFTVPNNSDDGMIRVGKYGKQMGRFYLLDRWVTGKLDAGSLRHVQPKGAAEVWRMSSEARQAAFGRWQKAILDDLVTEIRDTGREFNADVAMLNRIFGERDHSIIKTKRIIACTTNSAAKYFAAIQAASPGVVLVEEAGEILEAHILTSLGPHTQQLILIGDHKQLRPKCSYELSVEQGDGFDLNRSLFERLVLKGFPHVILTQQHRMRPEISSLIRHLTYPDLTDADSTLNREDLRGFRDNVVFVNHSHPELELKNSRELQDGRTSSKQNEFEGQMILKCVRYLAQQGYTSDKLVIITPYLGQLKLLRDQLAKENDPILNDLDKWDLVRAGLLSDLGSKSSKPSLRISTIDNYQGEESEIVLVSMTRSNKSHDIGFMSAPERLNVLLSRARNALIMIGNSETFMNARKGREVWRRLFDYLKEKDHIYEGFPVKCEKHPDRVALLCSPEQFELECPDGGCKEPCGVMLKCGLHKCPSSCHQLFNHSNISCKVAVTQKCSQGHKQVWECSSGAPPICRTCETNRKQVEKKAQRDLMEKLKRDAKIQKHQKEMAALDEEIARIKQSQEDQRLDTEQRAALAQKRKDIEAAKERAKVTHTGAADPLGIYDDGDPKPKSLTTNQPAGATTTPAKPAAKQHFNLTEHIKNKKAIVNNKSNAQADWQRQKDLENAVNPAIDAIMEMIGLEDVKQQVLKIKSEVDTSARQGTDLKKKRLGLVLLGNPGTGKTTVARHFAKILTTLNVLTGDGFVETTGSRLAHGGVAEVKSHLQELENAEGGVYFIDEAYQLAEGHNFGGKTVLDYLLAEIENLTGKVVFVFAGYRKEMEKFFEHNPGLASRIPYTLHFEDYSDDELLRMLQFRLNQTYKGRIDVEDDFDGLYMKIAVRRLGRGRGRNGFGNARALENMFSKIQGRQASRIEKERRLGECPDDFFMTKEDLIGPDPSRAILGSDAYAKLQQLTGLKDVKRSIEYMISLIKTNYERELKEQEPIGVSLNRVFLGSPGTGKTTVAKLYGRILADVGMLSNGEVVTKNPADFIGNVIGASEANTKAILATTIGKVLIIDEAYMLYSGSNSGGGVDIYKTAVIDTMVAEIQSVPGDDQCVLLLGYEQQMSDMFQNVNAGLGRRFQFSDPIRFEDFNDEELEQILLHKLKIKQLSATPQAISTALNVLSRLRNGLNFGNGGEVENRIQIAQANYQARQILLPSDQRSTDFLFEPQDFDLDYDRASNAQTNLEELFAGVIGCDDIVTKLGDLLTVARTMRARGLDPRTQMPMNFVFRGPPGTGKTTTARKFGQVYYDLGLLSQVEVVECSANDLTGEYVGQTAPKTIRQLEKALGKVLFIDEAYKLAQGPYGHEAINEVVDAITKPQFAGKLVIILAGYSDDMKRLLQINEGLSSRFSEEIEFASLSASHCLKLLEERLRKSTIAFPSVHEPSMHTYLLSRIEKLSSLPAWGNARDVETVAKSMVRKAFAHTTNEAEPVILTAEDAKDCIESMLQKCRHRASNQVISQPSVPSQTQTLNAPRSAPQVSSIISTGMKSDMPEENSHQPSLLGGDSRDPGVSDAIWQKLEVDKRLADERAELFRQAIREREEARERAQEAEEQANQNSAALCELEMKNKTEAVELLRECGEARARENEAEVEERKEEARKDVAALLERQAKIDTQALELLRRREQIRIREAEARAERERIQREVERMKREEMAQRRQEEQVQVKLRHMGVCPVGYRWIKQGGGYRCAGGIHWVGNASLGL